MSRPIRILVVDDSEDDRRVIRRFLTRGISSRYEIREASDAAQALDAVEASTPNALILDQHLGPSTGLELFDELRARGHHEVAVVFLTGSSGEMPDPISKGADDFLNKEDLTSAQLKRAVDNALGKAKMRYQLESSQRELATALAEVQSRADFEGRLLGVVSHDLRTPLSTISLACEMLDGLDELPKQARDLVNMAARNTKNMERMIEQLLDLTRVKSPGQFSLSGKRLDLAALVAKVVEDFSRVHRQHSFDAQPRVEGEVWCDPTAITQIIENLTRNAMQHSEPGRPIVVRSATAGGAASVAVTNHGAPIPEDLRARMFEPFQRADASGKGLGLGLYITRELARAHGGDVSLDCADGRVTFEVRWPVDGPPPS